MVSAEQIETPESPALKTLAADLQSRANSRGQRAWVDEELELLQQRGVFRWFHQRERGGLAWSEAELTRGYLALSRACLTTTFVLTQRTGACQRIEGSPNQEFVEAWLPRLVSGEAFATVGISHLTTSRQHAGAPTLRATESEEHFSLDGYSPWVTGASGADLFVVGATLADGRQVLLGVPRELAGVWVKPAEELLALEASQTGPVEFRNVKVPRGCLLQGPVANVLQRGAGAGTGGLQTTTLAVGLAKAATDYLRDEAVLRPAVRPVSEALSQECSGLELDLLEVAGGALGNSKEQLRQRANSLVLRATQAALATAKGAGYTRQHPVGRWCREALFFLVWSCPQPVINANLCEFAGLAD